MADNEKRYGGRKLLTVVFVLALLASSLYLLYNAYSVGVGLKVCLIILVISLILLGLLMWKYKAFTPKVIATIWIALAVFIGNSLGAVLNTMQDMHDMDDEGCISLIVMKDSEYTKAEQLSNKKIGIVEMVAVKDQEDAQKEIEKMASGVEYIKYDSLKELVDALYSNQIDAILLNESLRANVHDEKPSFDKETRVIGEYKYIINNAISNKKIDVTKDSFNLLISGMDTYGKLSSISRSDVNLVVSVNPKLKQIVMIGLPRDLYVAQPCQNNQKDKLTHAGMFGVEGSIKTVEQFLDIDIDYYAKVNFSTLINLIDAVGGVNVHSDYNFVTEVGGYQINAGNNYLDGNKALGFVRERHAFESGDRQRNQNQMSVIEGLIQKLSTAEGLKNYRAVLSAVGEGVQTNMKTSQMRDLVNLQLRDNSGWKVIKYQVDGSGTTAYSPANGFNSYMMVPNESTVNKAKQLLKDNLNNVELKN